MTDHERAMLDALNDYAVKLQKLDEAERQLAIIRQSKEAAWSIIQQLARRTTPA